MYLRSQKKIFGSEIPRGFSHPSDISVQTLRLILGSIEIERKEGARTVRGPAIAAELIVPVASGLAEAFREADPDQEIVVMAVRKQMQKYIFDRKYLTSFVAFIEGDSFYLYLSRSDWEIEEKGPKRPLPMPKVEDPQQKFRMVTGPFVASAGVAGVRVDWRSDVFSEFEGAVATAVEEAADGAPVVVEETVIEVQEKTVLMEAKPAELPPPAPLTSGQIEQLSPDDLRRLADLEDDRKAGRISEDAYRRERAGILDRIATESPAEN